MTPPLRRFLWKTVYGDAWRALGTSTRQPDDRVMITTCKGTRIENVHLTDDPGWHPAGWYLRVSGPGGDLWTVGPIHSAQSLPVPDTPSYFPPPGCVEDFGTVVLVDGDRYARHLDAEREDGAFLQAWNEARDIDTVVYPHRPDERPQGLRGGERHMEQIIDGLKYSTENADQIASDRYWDGSNFDRSGRNTYLYRTKKGRFFLLHTSMWEGERDAIEPVEEEDARIFYERLPEHPVSYAEAFGEEPEDA
ncbi:hypothetical protein [uncultured Methanofollis sp.]|uniref:hypothetical protein n=1 Tax=uncultured Methanofollis sp. TaxID=262500 RepID=UPI00260E185D|nr:hypothetical protein [uncultured Methanofollis sp.]